MADRRPAPRKSAGASSSTAKAPRAKALPSKPAPRASKAKAVKPLEAYLDEICALLSEGKSLRRICKRFRLKESTVRRWLSEDEAALSRTRAARELGCDALMDDCLDIVDDEDMDAGERRIRIDVRMRLAGKWSQRYADKMQLSGPDGAAIPVSVTQIELVGFEGPASTSA